MSLVSRPAVAFLLQPLNSHQHSQEGGYVQCSAPLCPRLPRAPPLHLCPLPSLQARRALGSTQTTLSILFKAGPWTQSPDEQNSPENTHQKGEALDASSAKASGFGRDGAVPRVPGYLAGEQAHRWNEGTRSREGSV